ASDQVISKPPQLFSGTPKAFQTAFDASTMLLRQGESHSSTTIAVTLLPLPLMTTLLRHLDPPLYQPVDRATTGIRKSVYINFFPS
ncbi:hypothetical protein MIMGU_mgv1a019854mg, partial [Erythranthe guttata]